MSGVFFFLSWLMVVYTLDCVIGMGRWKCWGMVLLIFSMLEAAASILSVVKLAFCLGQLAKVLGPGW